jgi:pSer/pThr/pTyr-binding forkhead associated (FHA) protein
VPKAKPFPEEDDQEEKTTIENGWEDEASTTVEQGEVAEKIREVADNAIRPLRTNVTGTGANQLDEPTVDDQHANSAIAAIAAAIAPGNVARLVITQGNDAGQEFDIRPGKAYTIGRAIDNDVVLTDIAVSRKHFDLRFQDGVWVVVDRGSGNGTVVNDNLEDNPFMLANGDVIEIGNTVFRFDQPEGTPRPRKASFSDEEDELSTVAGKPMRSETPDPEPPHRERPKTLPPPTPIRPRSPSTFPPLLQPPPQVQPQPASTMPLPQMANRAPMAPAAQAPTLLAAEPVPSLMPPGYQHSAQRPLMADYPQYANLPQQNVYGNGLLISPNGHRGDASTAHVSPTPYGSPVAQSQRGPVVPLSRRAMLILGAGALALLAGITTIAIVKSSAPAKKSAAIEPDTGSAVAKAVAPTPEPPKQEPPKQEPAKQEPPKPNQVIVTPPPPKQEPAKQEPPKQEPPKVVKKDLPPPPPPPKKDPPKVAKKDPPPPKKDPPKQEPPPPPPPKKDPPKRVAVADASSARSKADDLYHAKRFTEASNVLASAAKSADDSEAKDLRHLADLYVRVGRGLSAGTAPAAKPEDAFTTLRSAENFDRAAGGAFQSDFEGALAKVAPKAATAYMADKNYEQARTAVLEAEKLGAGTTGTTMVKQALERAAQDLYNQASKDASSDPASAKEKCQRIINFADSKGQWYQKAARLKATL